MGMYIKIKLQGVLLPALKLTIIGLFKKDIFENTIQMVYFSASVYLKFSGSNFDWQTHVSICVSPGSGSSCEIVNLIALGAINPCLCLF